MLIYGLSQPTAKAQEGGSSPASTCECPDCGGCYACDTNCACTVYLCKTSECEMCTNGSCKVCGGDLCSKCVDGVCVPLCASPLACCNGTCYDPNQCLTCSNGTVVSTCTDPCYPNCSNGNCLAPACSASWCEDVPGALDCSVTYNILSCAGGLGHSCSACTGLGSFVPQQPTVCSNAAGNSTPCQAGSAPCSVVYRDPGICAHSGEVVVVACFPPYDETKGDAPCGSAAQCK